MLYAKRTVALRLIWTFGIPVFPMLRAITALLLTISPFITCASERVIINSERIRLGDPESPEWEWFENDPGRSGPLELGFQAKVNPQEATLFIRQSDVKLEWRVHLNGKLLGKLFLMEEELTYAMPLPPDSLRDGENVLTILPPIGSADDIVLRDIILDPRPVKEAIHQATLEVQVREQTGRRIPCRITIVDENGALAPLLAAPGETLAVRPGVVYTGNGTARIGLRAGHYKVYASRGFEYGMASQQVDVSAGATVPISFEITREVPTPGLVSCDTHIHTLTLSGHGDSTLDERMLTIAGEGVELPIATEHNLHADYTEAAERSGMARYFTPVRGNEVTTTVGHFNIFPVEPGAAVPNPKLTDWLEIMKAIHATPGVQVVLLNHPRSVHNRFVPFGPENFDAETGESKGRIELSFDGLEVINSGAQQTDYMLVFRDWFALLNRGIRVTAVGASDSHDVSRFIVGQARTYIAASDEDPGHIEISTACKSLLVGRAYVSMGLLPLITVDERYTVGDLATRLPQQVRVRVKVLGPSWVRAEKVELFANGTKIQESAVDSKRAAAAGEKAEITWTIPRPAKDTYVVAIVTGPAVTTPFWAMTRPYQPASRKWQGRAIGATNPVWLDADGDGRFTAANAKPE
jgi:hypothetical protein